RSAASTSRKVSVDSQDPDSNLSAAAPQLLSYLAIDTTGALITTSTPTLVGAATAGYTVTIVDGDKVLGKVLVDATGSWLFTCPTLAKGTHNLAVYLTDPLGNCGLLSDPL